MVYRKIFVGFGLSLTIVLPAVGAAADKASSANIQEIMDTEIDPSADLIWDSVGVIESEAGISQRKPSGPAGWRKLEDAADKLIHGAAALASTRAVGGNGHGLLADASTPGIRTAAEIARDIESDPARFSAAAMRLRDAGLAAKTAIASRDTQKLLDAGAQMDAACEACHAAYWYPRTKALALPSDNVFAHFPERQAARAPRSPGAD